MRSDGSPSRSKSSPNPPWMPADFAWRDSVHVRERVTKNIVASDTMVSIISIAMRILRSSAKFSSATDYTSVEICGLLVQAR